VLVSREIRFHYGQLSCETVHFGSFSVVSSSTAPLRIARTHFSYGELNASRVFSLPPPRPRRASIFLGHSLRSNRRSILGVVAVSLVLLLHVCFCLAKEIPRDRRAHRQLHIDRILQKRQFRSATYITRQLECAPAGKVKTVTAELLGRVSLRSRSEICNDARMHQRNGSIWLASDIAEEFLRLCRSHREHNASIIDCSLADLNEN